uniref:Alpha-2-macroglobulin n=1 Tax=Leptobrachium leishanense TaxID=445787 RepID=A0A8C5WC29_9ANUR
LRCLYPSGDTLACFNFNGAEGQTSIQLNLTTSAGIEALIEKTFEDESVFSCLPFQIVHMPPPMCIYEVVATMEVSITTPTETIVNQTKVLLWKPRSGTLIQTDKPVYKPGQTVKFRILILKENLQPMNKQVKEPDPEKNRIGQWLNVKLSHGISEFSFALSPEPILGEYTIRVEDTAHMFSVEEYVLPKFEVTMKLPPVVLVNSESFEVKVCGRYTYGKPMRGVYHGSVCRSSTYYMWYWRRPSSPVKDLCCNITGQVRKGGFANDTIFFPDFIQPQYGNAYLSLLPFYSPSKSFLKLQSDSKNLPCEGQHEVRVEYIINHNELKPDTKKLHLHYLLASEASIWSSGSKDILVEKVGQDLSGSTSFNFPLTPDVSPKLRVLVHILLPGGEIVADSAKFTVQRCFKNKVSVQFSPGDVLPGSDVSLQIQAGARSLCGLRVVDQSVVLMKPEKELTDDKLYTLSHYCVVLLPRNSGIVVLHETAPDTITDWNAGAFCMGPNGFGLSPPTSLRVFQPFFVDLTLPYSVVRGESFTLKASVFNYLKECIKVRSPGGVEDEISLSAYVTTSLLESGLSKEDPLVADALTCLRKAAVDVSNVYTQALLAYTFTLAEDTETRQILLEKLEKQAVRKDGQLHWERPSAKPTSDLPYWYQAPSAEVELTAYMLMTGLSGPEKDLGRASEIVNWLSKQQNPYGGFSSTQDTVVALQSLGQYAGATFSDAGDVTVTVRSQTGVQEFHVDNTNRLLIQKASLPDIPGDYTLTASGSGCVYVQTVLRYNVPPPRSDSTFSIRVEVKPDQCPEEAVKKLQLQITVQYTGSREKSNMALIEVKMLSGFIPVKSSVKELEKSRRIQRGDVQTDMVTLYLDELVFEVEQDFDVKNLKPAAVKIYDYYETGKISLTRGLVSFGRFIQANPIGFNVKNIPVLIQYLINRLLS